MATSAGTYADERTFFLNLLGISDDTDISLGDLQLMAQRKRRIPAPKPLGFAIAQPAVPATTVPQVNNTGVDATVFITGGTVTVISIDGNATGLTSGAFRLGDGQSIAITYTVAPTWKWFGH